MTVQTAMSAIIQLALMLAVAAAYVLVARRFRALWHPVSIVAAVVTVGVLFVVLTTSMFGGGDAAMAPVIRRAAIGAFGWGVIIAAGVWLCRRTYARWIRGS